MYVEEESVGVKSDSNEGTHILDQKPIMLESPEKELDPTLMASALRCNPIRRQGSHDGDIDERRSLLLEDTDDEIAPKSTHSSTVLINKGSDRSLSVGAEAGSDCVEMKDITPGGSGMPLGATAAPPSDKPYSKFQKKRVTSAGFNGSNSDGASQNPHKFKFRHLSEADRKNRVAILQRELSRIQGELETLGELEIEVSYV